ncbi:transketolase [Erythrobacter longus]|uniref:Transketolase n=1 Tax=Erythrobacter longus TaxID=1044 RepID=A0A074ME46_ERYLO|nr:transketolase C-terminal domain-containing protein [Erythrobacter longus]KEO90108.1 transketolase [Erythrobacter longus]
MERVSTELVKRPHVENFIRWAKDRPEVVVLSADLTNSCEVGQWRDTYPDRFFSMGMAEQNMMGVAAGMAREGLVPFIHTFSVFIYRRAYDQLAMSIAYPNLKVRFFGFLPGIVTPGGVTHQAIEDVAIMRAVPNMTILETGDATEVESVLDASHGVDGPCYVRFLRGEMPRLFPQSEPMEIGKARVLSSGSDVAILTAGITTEEAMRASDYLARQGIAVRHLHISTHKPFDDPQVLAAVQECEHGVVTLENHLITGGLGTAVSELMTDHGIGKRLIRLGLNDTYAHGASLPYLLDEYGLDAKALVAAVGTLMGRELKVTDADIAATRQDSAASDAKAEAL